MSKKGHGPKTGGKHDANFTPAWAVDRLLEAWEPVNRNGVWVEPGAGDGAIIRAVNRHISVYWHAIEIQRLFSKRLYESGAAVVTIGDFLEYIPPLSDVSVVLGNPPFTWALEFILMAQRLFPQAEIVLLLSLNIVASAKRHSLMQPAPPDSMVLPDRPSFTVDGETDAQDYAWWRWLPGNTQTGQMKILNLTPPSDRRGLVTISRRRMITS